MAPFRASRSTRSGRPGGQTEQDVFDGLPVRQWRFQDATVTANEEPGQPQDVAIRGHGLWKELPMPKGSEHYTPWSQQILREARLGRIVISAQNYSRNGFGRGARDDDKENDMDTTIDGVGEDRRAKASGQGFMAKRWLQTPKHLEEPEVEHLAKRRRGMSSTHAKSDGVVAPPVVVGTLRKSRVRRVDEQGRTNMWEVLVPEGHAVDGEVDEPGMAENLGISISRPTPGTIIGGLGVANDDGVIVVSTTNVPAVSVVSTPVRPRAPRRKVRGGFRKGRGKKLGYGESGGVSASAEAFYASRDAATDTDNPATGDADEMNHAADNAGKDGGEEEETDGEIDEDDADEEDGEAEPDEDEADGDEDMNRDDDDDDREEGELTPSPEPPDAKELLARFSPSISTKPPPQGLKPATLPAHPLPAKPITSEAAQARTNRPNSPKPSVSTAPNKIGSGSPKAPVSTGSVQQHISSVSESISGVSMPLPAVAIPPNPTATTVTAPVTEMPMVEPVDEEPAVAAVERERVVEESAGEAVEAELAVQEPVVEVIDTKPVSEDPIINAAEEEPVVEEMVVDAPEGEPITQEPGMEESIDKEFITGQTTIEEVVNEELNTEEPVIEDPVADKAVAAASPIQETLTNEPTLDDSTTKEAIANNPVAEESVTEVPYVEEPYVEEPYVEEPYVEEPSVEEPIIAELTTEAPAIEASATESPMLEESTTAEPMDEDMVNEETAVDKSIDENMVDEEAGPEAVITESVLAEEPPIEDPKPEDSPAHVSEVPPAPAAASPLPPDDHPITEPEPDTMQIDTPTAQDTTSTEQEPEAKSTPIATVLREPVNEELAKETSPESMAVDVPENGDVYFPDGEVDLLGSLERGLKVQSREGEGEGKDNGEGGR